MMLRCLWPVLMACAALASSAQAADFRFSTEDSTDRVQEDERQARVNAMLQTPCRNKIKNQKIMVLIGENRNGATQASQSAFNPHVEAINARLQALGLKTFTQAQIRQQVAQAEIDAYFKNDPDAAISASRRLAAQYILRGLITSQTSRNLAVNVNQVNVSMNFTLTGANGRMISQASAENASYAGSDTAGMALTLINERADELVATLYSDYCQKSGVR
ncbi:hypothetical protein [Rhodoferax sp.]|uniref:hypothetical protein n=1 Tax=Rhodoferax sp. TaxID=50421 RepID=UPI001EB13B88|nr:hypothetical protein [Rhodoferax sp.]MBT9506168.1 hypothetical protein [Rhodoferax sp.]